MSEEATRAQIPRAVLEGLYARAGERSRAALAQSPPPHRLRGRALRQRAHLTCPATVWKYVEGAVTRSPADLVMLDLEDSIPRGDDIALDRGRDHVVRALHELDWGARLRFFRPRGLALDPCLTDLAYVVSHAGDRLEGVTLPKVEHPDEVRVVCDTLTELEAHLGLAKHSIALHVLIESVRAEERAFDIAAASPRITALVFGAFDYWGSLGMNGVAYRTDHPLIDQARGRIARAAASVGVLAIAEMTLNYPTKDKSLDEQRRALDECQRDAERARSQGFRGKWTGLPAQAELVKRVFSIPDDDVAHALRAVRAFLEAERAGRGAVMIDGAMADRATDRVHRVLLSTAHALGQIDDAVAHELRLEAPHDDEAP